MNEQQPYEKRLAEKLHQLPLPDVEPNWQQMKFLLDKEMPRGGGYWRWVTGIGLLLLMLGGTWYFTSTNKQERIGITVAAEPAAAAGKNGKESGQSTTSNAQEQIQNKNPPSTTTGITPSEKINTQITESNKKTNEEILLEKIKTENRLPTATTPSKNSVTGKRKNVSKIYVPNEAIKMDNDVPEAIADKTDKKVSSSKQIENSTNFGIPHPLSGGSSKSTGYDPEKYATIIFPTENSHTKPDIPGLAGDSLNKNYSAIFQSNKINVSGVTGKTKSAKSKNIAGGENKNLAFGFSLPMGFPLGDQKPGAYNINAKPNTVSDFIPVPHLQYHVNNKLYLQTEIQLRNPQFIQPVLLSQRRTEYLNTNSIHYNSIYARKLYYFNIPVGIHYSPFQHFYLGTGLQFSSLVSGVAMHEETSFVIGSGINTVVSQRYAKFKNDTISNKIDNSEFRLMLDANYYWKQFTVGLRYNQALSNYVSFRLNNVSPLFQDKNKSLQFYLRYNLWEDHKKRR